MPHNKRLLLPLALAVVLAGACGGNERPAGGSESANNATEETNNGQSPDAGQPPTGNADGGTNGGSDASDAGNAGGSDAGTPPTQTRQTTLSVGASGGTGRSANYTTRLIIGGPVPATTPLRSTSYRLAPGAGPAQHGQ